MQDFKSGLVNIIGLPNAGKSTLLNAIIGQKMSAVTHKAQTTRHRIKAIFNDAVSQIVFFDTPGIIQPSYLLQEKMMDFVRDALRDTDINLLIVDATAKNADYSLITAFLQLSNKPLIIAINKIDRLDTTEVTRCVDHWQNLYTNSKVLTVSALKKINLELLLQIVKDFLPIHPAYYDTDELTDRPTRFFIQELIREQILLMFHEEVPYSTNVVVDEYKEKELLTVIKATIFTERDTQKGIMLGHKGGSIKELGIRCRKQIEEFVGRKIFLELSIKVRKDWRNNDPDLKRWGYNL